MGRKRRANRHCKCMSKILRCDTLLRELQYISTNKVHPKSIEEDVHDSNAESRASCVCAMKIHTLNEYDVLELFNKEKVPSSVLLKLSTCECLVFSYYPDTQTILIKKDVDTFKIVCVNGSFRLFHNNYVRCLNGDRVLSRTFHQESLHGVKPNLTNVLQIVLRYSYTDFHTEVATG